MKTIDSYNFSDKRVLIRVDFNVPLKENPAGGNPKYVVADNARIKAAMPTIKKILNDGGSAILMSHLGRPKNGPEDKFSLKYLIGEVSSLLNTKVKFINKCVGEEVRNISENLAAGDVLVLENLRFYNEEKNGDDRFAKQLSELADIYVNDAFGTAHRKHASTCVVARFFSEKEKMFGFLVKREIENADKVLKNISRPFTAIMGGAKVSDKILLIEQMLNKVDNLIIGGGMVYTFLKSQGYNIGNSLVENDKLDLAKSLLKKAEQKKVHFLLPVDSVIADKFSDDAITKITADNNIYDGWMGLDIGPLSCKLFEGVILKSKTILWNGPMGVFEFEKFQNGTRKIAESIVSATQNGAYSLIGGGDSSSAIKKLGYKDKVSFVSTGGGALLEYMEGKKLPAITAILG